MPSTRFDVVIPAGGEIDGDYAERAGARVRALAPTGPNREPVLQVVVNALRSSGNAGTIIVVGPNELRGNIDGVDLWLPEGLPDTPQIQAGPGNVIRGLRELSPERQALVCTSDLPFLTAEAVADFAGKVDVNAGIAAGLVPAQAYLDRFPSSPPSEFVALRETGPVTMAGLFSIRPAALLSHQDRAMEAFTARKSQWRLIKLLGPKLVWQFASRRLSLTSICERLEGLLECRIDVLRDAMPETAFDIDTPEDFDYAAARS